MSAKLKHIYAPAPKTERGKPTHIGIGKIKKQVTKLLYCNGKQVIIRDFQNPLDTWLYEEHKHDTTVARVAPSGFYIASADTSGRVIVWDCVGEDKVIKLDKQSIGVINDMSWSDDSKRIAVGGSGREKFGEAFFMDGGSSVGDISGHTKPLISVDFKQTRPYRMVTGSEDFSVGWFEGPPFKFKKTITEHSRYVNCVRFSPDGNKFISVGSDKKGVFYDGKEATKSGELSADHGHSGSIFSAVWSADGAKVATSSADKTVKIWTSDGAHVQTYSCLGEDVADQQVGLVWADGRLASVSLAGSISILDENSTTAPLKVLLGHNKIISALAYDASANRAYTADVSGYVVEWNPDNGDTKTFKGAAHTSQIRQMTVNSGKLLSVSIDDTIKFSTASGLQYGESIPLGSQPSSLSSHKEWTVIACSEAIVVLKDHQIVQKHQIKYQASSIALSPDCTHVAVGGKDNKIYLYSFDNGAIKDGGVLEGHKGEVTSLAYSPDGKYLAAGDGNREVVVWEGKAQKSSGWVFHNSRVQTIAWAPDNIHIASGSVDSSFIVWNIADPAKRIHQKLAHMGGVRAVTFRDARTLLSVGEDCAMKAWDLNY